MLMTYSATKCNEVSCTLSGGGPGRDTGRHVTAGILARPARVCLAGVEQTGGLRLSALLGIDAVSGAGGDVVTVPPALATGNELPAVLVCPVLGVAQSEADAILG